MTTVLVVDDVPENIAILSGLLLPYYQVRAANCGKRALQVAKTLPKPDLILLDIMMPDIDGYEVLKQLKKNEHTADIPVIFVTALESEFNEEQGFALGAVDYITKPIIPAIVLARVKTHVVLKESQKLLKDSNTSLELEVEKRMQENHFIQDASIYALAYLAEIRDPETGNHLRRTKKYMALLCQQLQTHPKFIQFLNSENIQLLIKSTPLHDIGKVGIPDSILLKAGKLTADERNKMKMHTCLGFEAITLAEQEAEKPIEFLRMAKDVTLYHHEKWDGSGYPHGLSGNNIPIAARLMALADVFDALISQRVYKPPFSLEKTTNIIKEGKNKHFDPDIVDAFIELKDDFHQVALKYADTQQDVLLKLNDFERNLSCSCDDQDDL